MDIIHEYLQAFVERRHGGTTNFILMEDNCRRHRAINVGKKLALRGLQHHEWAPQSPDMNPLANAWSV